MKRLERLALWLLITAGLCSCVKTSEVKADEKLAIQEEKKTAATQSITETVQTGPSETVIYKFAPPDENEPVPGNAGPPVVAETEASTPDRHGREQGGARVRPISDPSSSLPVSDGLPPHGPLVEMQIIRTGPTLATKAATSTASSCEDLGLNLEKHTQTKTATRYGPPLWLLALLAAALALVGWLVWRFSLFGRIAAFLRG